MTPISRLFRTELSPAGQIAIVALICASLMLVTYRVARIHPVITPSVPRGLYRLVALGNSAGETIAVGDRVFACIPATYSGDALAAGYIVRLAHATDTCPGDVIPIVKRVRALPGDTVDVADTGILIDGVLAPRSRRLAVDGKGRPIRRIPAGHYTLGQDEFWLSGDSIDSYDSRDFGPVTLADILGLAVPLVLIDPEPKS